jgi:hypothetical protein
MAAWGIEELQRNVWRGGFLIVVAALACLVLIEYFAFARLDEWLASRAKGKMIDDHLKLRLHSEGLQQRRDSRPKSTAIGGEAEIGAPKADLTDLSQLASATLVTSRSV